MHDAETTLSSTFQILAAATGKARLSTVDRWKGGDNVVSMTFTFGTRHYHIQMWTQNELQSQNTYLLNATLHSHLIAVLLLN